VLPFFFISVLKTTALRNTTLPTSCCKFTWAHENKRKLGAVNILYLIECFTHSNYLHERASGLEKSLWFEYKRGSAGKKMLCLVTFHNDWSTWWRLEIISSEVSSVSVTSWGSSLIGSFKVSDDWIGRILTSNLLIGCCLRTGVVYSKVRSSFLCYTVSHLFLSYLWDTDSLLLSGSGPTHFFFSSCSVVLNTFSFWDFMCMCTISVFGASALEWRQYRMETGVVVIVELKSQWRPSQSRKESILNCLFMEKGSFMYKSKGGIGSRNIKPLGSG